MITVNTERLYMSERDINYIQHIATKLNEALAKEEIGYTEMIHLTEAMYHLKYVICHGSRRDPILRIYHAFFNREKEDHQPQAFINQLTLHNAANYVGEE